MSLAPTSLFLTPSPSISLSRTFCNQRTLPAGKSAASPPLSNNDYQQQQHVELKSWLPYGNGQGLCRGPPFTAVKFRSILPALQDTAGTNHLVPDREPARLLRPIPRARSSVVNDSSSEQCTARGAGLNHLKLQFVCGGEVLGGCWRKGSGTCLQKRHQPFRPSRYPHRNAIVAQVPTASLDQWGRRHALFACSGRIVETARLLLVASLCVAWIPRDARYGRGRMCVHAETGDEVEKSPHEQRCKQEIHGRRTRAGRPSPRGPHNNIMLQGFNWESWKGTKDGKTWWQVLKSQVEELSTLGVTDIWLPPVSQAVDRQGYLPSELYNLDASKYGTGVQLKELIDDLHNHGICVIADIVINHRSGKLQDNKGHWNVFKGGNRDKRLDWGPWAVVDDDVYDSGGKGHHDTGESYAAAPDLDHTNKQVQDELTDWMNWLKAEIGFDGWRFDFVKGYAPGYTKLYCLRTNPTIAVGELWTSMVYYDGQLSWDQNRHRQELCNWIDGTGAASSAFDFTTKGILQRAVENELWRLKDGHGQPPGLMGWWPEKAVTFLDNHDTGSTQRHWAFPDRKIILGYAYILTHPGTPCIFYDHIYDYKLMNEIKKLLDLRKRHRINAISRVSIQKAEGDIYIGKIDNRVILKLGPRYDMGSLLPGKDVWKMTLTGPDYAIWETTAPLPPLPIPPLPTEDDEQGKAEPSHPTQPIHITSKMSEETRNRILKEVPELVDPKEAMKTNLTKPTRSEQDHVHKEKVEKPLLGVIISKGKAGGEPGDAAPTENAKNGGGTENSQVPLPASPSPTTLIEQPNDEKVDGNDKYKIPAPDTSTLMSKTQTKTGFAAPVQKLDSMISNGTEKPRNDEKHHKHHKDMYIRAEIHGRRIRPGRPTPHGPYNHILLQGFNWESPNKTKDGQSWWAFLKPKVADFAALGITDVWLPPPSQSVDKNGYLPCELYNLDASSYGTGAELKELIDELHLKGICVVADIVINHRCGGLQDDVGRWNVFKGGNQDKRLDWGPWAVVDDDVYDWGGRGTHDTGEKYPAAPDLDHTNKQVQDELTDWMNWLRAEIGFDGWRFDFVKGYDPKFTNLYCARTNPTISIGELWTSMAYYNGQLEADQNGHRQHLCNWIDGTKGASCLFDFTTKGILQQAVENELWRLKDSKGKPPGLIGWYPQNAVTFIDNHDTGSTQQHWVFPDGKVEMGYAYITTHPGIPCIFIDHIYDFKLMDQIQKLLNIRVRNRINAKSHMVIQKAEANIYVAKIDDRLILKLGSRVDMDDLLPDKSIWKMVTSGVEYCIWESTEVLPPLHLDEVEAEPPGEVILQPPQPTQPIRLTRKMSEGTRKRILEEVPELVKLDDDAKKKKKSHR